MSQFLTDTVLKVLRGQFREGRQLFSLVQDVHYQSDLLNGVVTVPAGYVTDLASVPKLPLTWLLAGGCADEAAVIHDWLYTVHAFNGKEITRATADAVLREAIAASDDKTAPGWLMWAAVRLGGSGSWKSDAPDQPDRVHAAMQQNAP